MHMHLTKQNCSTEGGEVNIQIENFGYQQHLHLLSRMLRQTTSKESLVNNHAI